MPDKEKYVDESWKESVTQEKEILQESHPASPDSHSPGSDPAVPQAAGQDPEAQPDEDAVELNFINYITSLIFQAMIFLGEVPNPMNNNEIDRNPQQAKFLIDTLILLREKTRGNLNSQEDQILNSSIYELEMKYVECISSGKGVV